MNVWHIGRAGEEYALRADPDSGYGPEEARGSLEAVAAVAERMLQSSAWSSPDAITFYPPGNARTIDAHEFRRTDLAGTSLHALLREAMEADA